MALGCVKNVGKMKQTNETMFFYKKGYQKEKETKSDQEFRENNFLNYKNGI